MWLVPSLITFGYEYNNDSATLVSTNVCVCVCVRARVLKNVYTYET